MSQQQSLNEHQAILQSILDNSMDAILLTAPDGRIFRANPAACRLFQRSEEELCRLGRQAVLDAADSRLAEALARRERFGHVRCELTLVRADGTRFPGEVTSTVFLDHRGEQRMSMFIRDVTERKCVEEALRVSEARYRAVVEDQTEVICRFQADGTLTFVNEVYCRLFGKTTQELVGKNWYSVVLGQDLPPVEEHLRTLSAAHPIVVIENRVHAANGQVRWMQFVNRGFFDAAGCLTEIQAVGRDITERKQAEVRLRESEAMARARLHELETVLDATPAITVIAHDRDCRQMTCSRTAYRLFRLPPSANASKSAPAGERPETFRALKDGRELGPEELPVQIAAATGEPVRNCELSLVFPEGRVRELVGDAVPLFDGSGRVRGAVGAFLDITERKQAEVALSTLLRLLPQTSTRHEYLDKATQLLQQCSGCRCVGIRLVNAEGYIPYESYVGFSAEFWASENWLSVDQDRCACTRVVTGRSIPRDQPFTTCAGSFYCRQLSEFARQLPPEEMANYRGRCMQSEFESLAIVPLRHHGQTLGAIHLADETPGKLSPQVVELIETMAPLIGEAVHKLDMEEELRTSREQLRALAAQLQSVREEERIAVAREIHDVLAQELTLLKMDIAWLQRHLARPLKEAGRKQVSEELEKMAETANRAIVSVQQIATELRPQVLDSLGLCAAAKWLLETFEARSGLRCTLLLPAGSFSLKPDYSTALFRILQESLTNVARHARATRVEVSLERQPAHVRLVVRDNGCGVPAAQLNAPQSVGLIGMRERALLLEGQCTIVGQADQGTTVEVKLPLRKDAPENQPG